MTKLFHDSTWQCIHYLVSTFGENCSDVHCCHADHVFPFYGLDNIQFLCHILVVGGMPENFESTNVRINLIQWERTNV